MEVEWLILADSAQVVGSKLYLMGGGWDRLNVPKFPHTQTAAIAASVVVPWNETNEKHTFEIRVDTEDGETVARMNGGFEVGRPPGIPKGQDQRMQLALGFQLAVKDSGTIVIVASVDGAELKRTVFNIVGPPVKDTKAA